MYICLCIEILTTAANGRMQRHDVSRCRRPRGWIAVYYRLHYSFFLQNKTMSLLVIDMLWSTSIYTQKRCNTHRMVVDIYIPFLDWKLVVHKKNWTETVLWALRLKNVTPSVLNVNRANRFVAVFGSGCHHAHVDILHVGSIVLLSAVAAGRSQVLYIISKCTVETDTQLTVQGQHPTALGNELTTHIHLSQMYLQTTSCLTQWDKTCL